MQLVLLFFSLSLTLLMLIYVLLVNVYDYARVKQSQRDIYML